MLYLVANSLLGWSASAGLPASHAAARFQQQDVSMMARTPLIAGNWKVRADCGLTSLSTLLRRLPIREAA